MLKVYDRAGTIIFQSTKRWIHPLFELESFVATLSTPHLEDLFVEDSVIGHAAALLLTHIGIQRCQGGVLSRPALKHLEESKVTVTWGILVERISCQTESLLSGCSREEAYLKLKDLREAECQSDN